MYFSFPAKSPEVDFCLVKCFTITAFDFFAVLKKKNIIINKFFLAIKCFNIFFSEVCVVGQFYLILTYNFPIRNCHVKRHVQAPSSSAYFFLKDFFNFFSQFFSYVQFFFIMSDTFKVSSKANAYIFLLCLCLLAARRTRKLQDGVGAWTLRISFAKIDS